MHLEHVIIGSNPIFPTNFTINRHLQKLNYILVRIQVTYYRSYRQMVKSSDGNSDIKMFKCLTYKALERELLI